MVYANASLGRRRQLQRLSNTGIRYIFGLKWNEHITPHRKQLKWLLIDSRRDYFAMLIMHRVVRMKEPPFILPLFKPYQTEKPKSGPRQYLEIPTVNTDSGLLSFQVKYANLWNATSPCIRYLSSYSQFKKSIKIHFSKLENQ